MYSMTGFGRGKAPLANGELVIELKTVNHRFLEIRSRTPSDLSGVEPIVERLTRAHLSRGHCTIHVAFERPANTGATLNTDVLCAHIAQLQNVAEKTGVPIDALLPIAAQDPHIFQTAADINPDDLAHAAQTAFREALDKLLAIRRADGQSMVAEIATRLDNISDITARIQTHNARTAETTMARTQARLAHLLRDTAANLDKNRLELEIAILADKTDIVEELTRLSSHVAQMKQHLHRDAPAGRRLDFIIQEISREANTIGAKTASAEIAHLVVDLKSDLERIRELVQNLE
ncbi:MAG: YicC family protein [Proteobacteria bacterium]|nr:YicC family protein [Pseudomonadota bacterium]